MINDRTIFTLTEINRAPQVENSLTLALCED